MTSYVIGFIISIIFTINPYLMVVNKMVTGNALLVTILVFAVLQMAVQLLFFLHLGRGPKPLYNVVFFGATAAIIVITVGASLFIMSNLYRNMSPAEVTQRLAQDEGISQVGGEETGACQGNNNNHLMTIDNGTITPAYISAKRCDTLTIYNKDSSAHTIIYGSYPSRRSYGGEDSIIVRKDMAKTITLNETGNRSFYDADNPDLSATFSVKK